jgi:hypothetical protein
LVADSAQHYQILEGMLSSIAPRDDVGFLKGRRFATARTSMAAFDHQISFDLGWDRGSF